MGLLYYIGYPLYAMVLAPGQTYLVRVCYAHEENTRMGDLHLYMWSFYHSEVSSGSLPGAFWDASFLFLSHCEHRLAPCHEEELE